MTNLKKSKKRELQEILFSQGFGTRRVCAGLVEQSMVRVGGEIAKDAYFEYDTEGLTFDVFEQGKWSTWPYCELAYLMINKPAAYEVSQKPSAWPSVYSLLNPALRSRNGGKLQAVGRLDQDTTGLLLLSDDGQFIHRMSSPKKAIEKIYRVTCKHPVRDVDIEALKAGVVLKEAGRYDQHVAASSCERMQGSECVINLGLTEGKYHQVKRMLAAVGNRVEALHRWKIGALTLPDNLELGAYLWLSADDLKLLNIAS